MDARTLGIAQERPLIARLDGMQQGHDSASDRETADERLVQLLGEFFRGGKEKRRQMLQGQPQSADSDVTEDGEDKYEPQRLTRKIHWQYDRSMKKVPMLRRDYIG
jgi:hypothetical protein